MTPYMGLRGRPLSQLIGVVSGMVFLYVQGHQRWHGHDLLTRLQSLWLRPGQHGRLPHHTIISGAVQTH